MIGRRLFQGNWTGWVAAFEAIPTAHERDRSPQLATLIPDLPSRVPFDTSFPP